MTRGSLVWHKLGDALSRTVAGVQSWRRTQFVRSFVEAWRWGIAALLHPVPTLQQAADEKPVLAAMWLTLLQGLSLAVGTRYATEHGGFVLSLVVKNLPSWGWVIFYAVFVPPVIWFLKAAVLNLVAELLGGPPRGLSLLAATAVACSPLLLVLPAALMAVAFADPDLNAGFIGHLWFVFAIGVHAWWVVLTIFAVRETYRFTLAQAFLTVFLTVVLALPLSCVIYLTLRAMTW
ncbi:hypothetical protein HRbin17_01984 [bacterium HR17]|uniref:Yip1 domain-containing protein n=1 Tax=Candidatus Fervidibacter japonicus TaxID=2035412 RepID=A0A2H5XE52_9BACT|nr:hypothetical protein HRbin17_01984 [bacterium HR17]